MSGIGLEVWLLGTPAELDTAARALGTTGAVVYHAERTALTGTDTGRWRTYARIRIPLPATPPTPVLFGPRPEDPPTLLDQAA